MIIVHDGKAHHDDFLATCVLIYKTNARAIRTKFTQEHLADPSCWVIDQGMSFNPEMHNFDHHHIKEEICAFTMVLDYFYGKSYREILPQLRFIEIFDSYGPKAAAKFAKTSEESLELSNSPICAAIINVFSNISGDVSVPLYSVMREMGKSICETIENTASLLKMVADGVKFFEFKDVKIMDVLNCKIKDGFKIEELPTKKYCKINKIEVDVVLTENSRGGGYRMISSNTDVLKFVANEKSFFTHNSGFLTCFYNLEDYKEILTLAVENSNVSTTVTQ